MSISNKQICVNFLLPTSGNNRCGGFKVIYEHANGLAKRGYKVIVTHATSARYTALREWRSIFPQYLGKFHHKQYYPHWFALDSQIEVRWVPMLHHLLIPNADVVVASSWQTAEWAINYPMSKGRKMYFVQDYEYYMSADEETKSRMARTYQAQMQAISISPAVEQMLIENGNSKAINVPNGIDFETFYSELPCDAPERITLGFACRKEPFKATQDAVKALERVREKLKLDLRVWCFGKKDTASIPDWIEFIETPNDAQLRRLYNQTAVFVVPSHYEGWGLPGAEAMACGAALVSTDNGGCRAYAHHGKNALLSPPGDTNTLADNILLLSSNKTLRVNLAQQGQNHIKQFTWQHATDVFEHTLKKVITEPL